MSRMYYLSSERKKVSLLKERIVYRDYIRDQHNEMLKKQADSNLRYQRIVEQSNFKGLLEW